MERQLPRAAKPAIDLSEYVTATEYCAANSISPPTLYRRLKQGIGPETIPVSKNCQLFRLPDAEARAAR